MSLTFKIANLERATETGGVTVAHWTASKADGDYSASSYGSIGFTPDPTAEGFKPYDTLTEDDVIAWVVDSLGAETVEAMELNMDNSIAEQKAPKTATGMPWAV